jgi:cell division transport system ATP-binding protein
LNDELLRLEDVGCCDSRGLPLFEHVSFTLNTGSVLWVTGPSGSGKSTLMKLIMKECRPRAGTILYRGRSIWGSGSIGSSALRREMGVIFQEDCLLPERSVFENAAAALELTDCSKAVVRDQSYRALAEVGLTLKANQSVQELSSSELRLLSLARVLAKRPLLVLADLNTCEVDQKTIAPRLEALATYGCGVLIFSKHHAQAASEMLSTSDLALR